MKRLFVAFFVISGLLADVVGAAAPVQRRGRNTAAANASSQTTVTNSTTAARAATVRNTRGTTAQQPATTNRVAARAATTPTTVQRAPTVAARAGVTQKVINTGTKVASAAKNSLVSDECLNKFNGCMDAFCMLDNESGGRCICSDKNKTFDKILKEIQEYEQRSYEIATMGVEQLEMGLNADGAVQMADEVMQKMDAKKKRSNVDLSMWKSEEDGFGAGAISPIDGKTGSELYSAVSAMCIEQVPECANSVPMMQMMYSRQIESDCTAYENSLEQKRTQAIQNIDTAERALRGAALEQYQNINKYDLGQCTIEFKKCMQTTAGCGDDFSGCAATVAMDNTNVTKSTDKGLIYTIKGAETSIDIAASTYDTLLAKKPMCESVTKQCVRVADQVFDAFLKEAAPQIRAAEIIAEDNLRQNCIVNISDCFQTACKDNIDPSDPDGSYDMCLSRPETMLNLCKIPLNACGIDTLDANVAKQSEIWNFVTARLASMRVDACTTQIKDCLKAKDRCGSDYAQCLGLDMNSIIEMCPVDKLTACNSSQYKSNSKLLSDYVYSVAQGLLLNVDNNFMEICQAAVKSKMVEVCGSATSCVPDNYQTLGSNVLRSVQQENGDWLIDGLVLWGNFNLQLPDYSSNPKAGYVVKYNLDLGPAGTTVQDRINATVVAEISNQINRKMDILLSDPTVNMCVLGRDMSQVKRGAGRDVARFPNLLAPYANTMFDSMMDMAQTNYDMEYANLYAKANSLSEQYKNTLFCNAMAVSSSTADMKQTEVGIKEMTDYSVLIAGTSTQNQLDAINAGADIENIISVEETVAGQTRESEIARERLSAVYEPGPQVCRITKTIYPCLGYSAAYNSESESWNFNVGAQVAGFGGEVGGGHSSSSTKFVGKTCTQYAEPLITEQVINFADEDVILGNITRSNVTTMVTDMSTNYTTTNKGWSVSASANVQSNQNFNDSTINGNVTNGSFSSGQSAGGKK